jgi:hypothetical protein
MPLVSQSDGCAAACEEAGSAMKDGRHGADGGDLRLDGRQRGRGELAR